MFTWLYNLFYLEVFIIQTSKWNWVVWLCNCNFLKDDTCEDYLLLSIKICEISSVFSVVNFHFKTDKYSKWLDNSTVYSWWLKTRFYLDLYIIHETFNIVIFILIIWNWINLIAMGHSASVAITTNRFHSQSEPVIVSCLISNFI